MGRLLAISAAITAMSCGGNKTTVPATDPVGSATPELKPVTPPPADAAVIAGPPPRVITAAEIAGDVSCGPFKTSAFGKAEQALLDDRIQFRFVPGGKPDGGPESAKLEVTKGGVTMFVGARELFQRGDAQFAQYAAKRALFDGGYEAIAIPGRDPSVAIIAGVLTAPPASAELVSLAHGWFLDPNGDVLDVAIFASGITAANLADCRTFSLEILNTVGPGARRLAFATGTDVETEVSYATFKYRLPADWILTSAAGIHDFSRMAFRKRGVFPDGYTTLQLGLDAHPGDWKSPGDSDGTRTGMLFGLPVTWNLTKDASGSVVGAWTISKDVTKRDHAVASITATSAADRDEAIKLAESIRR